MILEWIVTASNGDSERIEQWLRRGIVRDYWLKRESVGFVGKCNMVFKWAETKF